MSKPVTQVPAFRTPDGCLYETHAEAAVEALADALGSKMSEADYAEPYAKARECAEVIANNKRELMPFIKELP